MRQHTNTFCALACIGLLSILAGCQNSSDRQLPVSEDTPADTLASGQQVQTADIAMTARSLADALAVGEQLDSTDYDFEGILTDGQGSPLYTNMRGTPGRWVVEVTSPRGAAIRNTDLGDLLVEDLRVYLAQSLNMDDSDIVEAGPLEDDTETHMVVYRKGVLMMVMESRMETASNGTEAPWLSVLLRRNDDSQ